ncbi:MAG: type 1 glutamine amidotransferase, partial [Nocardioidaceae bacterium]
MSRPRILVIEHEEQCPPGWLGEWLVEAGASLDVRRAYAGQPLPNRLTHHDGLVVLGGSMGANDDAKHGWLTATKQLLRQAVADDVPTLGVCLGHQLLAAALGGTVGPNPNGQ